MANGKTKNANIFEMANRRTKRSEIWDSGGTLEGFFFATSGTLADGQVSYAPIWQFWKSTHISETTAHWAKISSISTPWGRKSVLCAISKIWPMARFYAKYCNFEHHPVSRKPPAHSTKITSIFRGGWGGGCNRRIHVQMLDLLSVTKFHAQKMWQFRKWIQVLYWYLWSFSVKVTLG